PTRRSSDLEEAPLRRAGDTERSGVAPERSRRKQDTRSTPPILPQEPLDPPFEEGVDLGGAEVSVSEDGDDGGADGVDDEVPHGVDEAALLHVEAEDLVHGELEDLPEGAEGNGEGEGEEGDEGRAESEVAEVLLVDDVDKEEPEDSEEEAGSGVEDGIPPPEAGVISADLAKEERSEDEDDREDVELGRDVDPPAALEEDGEEGQEGDPGRGGGGQPLPVEEGQHDAHGQDQAKHQGKAPVCGAFGAGSVTVGFLAPHHVPFDRIDRFVVWMNRSWRPIASSERMG